MNKETTLNEIGEMLSHVVEHMATKEDVVDLRTELKSDIEAVKLDLAEVKDLATTTASELAIVRRDVEDIKETVESHNGFAKEIDHTMGRVAVIEKHLGLATS
jgi:hypothetical protein